MTKYIVLLVALTGLGCATGFRVGNVAYGGSFVCGSVDTNDAANVVVLGCVEEALHGAKGR